MKSKTHIQVCIRGNKVRVIETPDGEFQAQTKTRYQKRFTNIHYRTETFDHACYWALNAIEIWYQDDRTFAKE